MFFKNFIFGFKSQIFLNNFEWGIKYFKPKGRKKSLEGRTLAMSGLLYRYIADFHLNTFKEKIALMHLYLLFNTKGFFKPCLSFIKLELERMSTHKRLMGQTQNKPF